MYGISRQTGAAMLTPATDAVVGTVPARDRSGIPDRYKWDLANIYPTDAGWRAAKEALVAALPTLRRSRVSSPPVRRGMADALELSTKLSRSCHARTLTRA